MWGLIKNSGADFFLLAKALIQFTMLRMFSGDFHKAFILHSKPSLPQQTSTYALLPTTSPFITTFLSLCFGEDIQVRTVLHCLVQSQVIKVGEAGLLWAGFWWLLHISPERYVNTHFSIVSTLHYFYLLVGSNSKLCMWWVTLPHFICCHSIQYVYSMLNHCFLWARLWTE